jgi:N4-(beta-N-acetylglucosaminyl)-L-asparaginase
LAHGFQRQQLLTDASRQRWEEWRLKERGAPDTIGLVALDSGGDLAAGCSTSGLAFKLPGRVGDSPIVGSGLYVDNDVGGAAATGLGEQIMRFCASFLVVELMRAGQPPADACRSVVDRILSKPGTRKDVTMGLIALAKGGEWGAACTLERFPHAVWTPTGVQMHGTQ